MRLDAAQELHVETSVAPLVGERTDANLSGDDVILLRQGAEVVTDAAGEDERPTRTKTCQKS
uniref:hypothetical protein n=1 Tax=Ornithinimicrobium sufpigmenti TaxID=2508882 RepID=UPI0037CBD769